MNVFKSSQRMHDVQSPIIPIIADLINKTPDTISLGQGVVFYGPPKSAISCAKQLKKSLSYHLYSSVEGIEELRIAISKKIEFENNIKPDNQYRIIVTAGSNMGFTNAIMAIADVGDEIILLAPYYFNHEMAITMLNCKPVIVACDENYQPILNNIEAAITNKTRAIVTISPNNPTGAVYSKKVLTEINQLCRDKGLFHISDEAYEYFTYDQATHFSPASIKNASEHTISLFSLSKAYGFASWRVGYMLIPEELYLPVKKVQDTILICPVRISQEASIAALKEGKPYCLSHLKQIRAVRNELYNALTEIEDFCITPKTDGAFYFLLKLDTKLSGMEVVRSLIKDYKIAVIPGETFGLNNGCYLRVAYGALDKHTSSEGIQRLIHGLNEIIK